VLKTKPKFKNNLKFVYLNKIEIKESDKKIF